MRLTPGLFSTLAVALGIAPTVIAQTSIKAVGLGTATAENSAYWFPSYAISNFPVMDMDSEDLRCRTSDFSMASNALALGVPAGRNMTVVWDSKKSMVTNTGTQYAPSGPCTVYMAKLSSQGTGSSWFKIYEYGYKDGKWCTDYLKGQMNKMTFNIPQDIPNGKYIVRAEIISLRTSTKTNYDDFTQGAQFFPSCLVVDVTNGGSASPSLSKIPGIYKKSDSGLLGNFGAGQKLTSYKVPGPAVYTAGTSSTSSS
ncbi:glycosyl hydrolase family 61-domain-containing protein [Kickxella alabastrina]|uniref:glycosyl hydrolase family 61-domain-containing protein n=1 Tax=Kickxella alabastrina TaxID=61397 RepID=UPI00221F6D38|nr:glycosyl hydrolase family 61-domain-containing protein [Kickxella alabastrina]KAI7822123.1 glycosyl hydrolase family 61-domain-containing protein [Kickxella alabastrina]KAJ1946505.1 hypothetical protein GGF37_001130 [Kickxella alabastrina]